MFEMSLSNDVLLVMNSDVKLKANSEILNYL